MHKSLLLSAALVGTSLAQSSVLTLLLPQHNTAKAYVGSVISADSTATSVSVTCAPQPTATGEAAYCELGDNFRGLYKPSALEIHMGLTQTQFTDAGYAMTMDFTCSFSLSTQMTCSGTMVSTSIQGTVTSTSSVVQTEVISDLSSLMAPVTMTAGAEKLTGGTAAPTTTSGQTQSTGTTSKSTGGMPRITQNAVLVGIGAAVVGGVAMI